MEKLNLDSLNHNTKLCMMALLNVYAAPDGYFYPCCVSRTSPQDRLLDSPGGSLRDAFNSEKMQSIRQQLANGIWPSVCTACQSSEDAGRKSHRQVFNESALSRHTDVIECITLDGRVNYPIKSLDIRWNNTCNFKCRMCGPTFSSAWEQDYKAMGREFQPTYDWSSIVETDEFLSVLGKVSNIYFAGGEPLITDAHYEVLNKAIELKAAQDISLSYTTNLSILKYKHHDLLELWKHFKEVHLTFSLDGFGTAVEYSREGFNHDRFIKNFEKLRQAENITLSSHCVSSIFSILSIPDYIQFCQLNSIDFSITCMLFPPYYSSKILSDELKKIVRDLYHQKLQSIDYDYAFILDDMDRQLEKASLLRLLFKQETVQLDKLRNRDFCDYFPVFANWFQNIGKNTAAPL